MKRFALSTALITMSLISWSCHSGKSFYEHAASLNEVPTTFEKPDADTNTNPSDNNTTNNHANDGAEHKDPDLNNTGAASQTTQSKIDKNPDQKKPDPNTSKASLFIKNAYWVIQNEAKKIGTPCNFYVMRVLELSGYSKAPFTASDFDVYAEKHFSYFKREDFSSFKNVDRERIELKKFIWSYPERTPFILQWQRSRGHGHIAILERMGDSLIIYQANMGKFVARRDQTTVDLLLDFVNRSTLSVYVDFYP